MASTVLASTAIMLSSIIAVLMSGGGSSGCHRPFAAFYGDDSNLGFSIKFFSILVCFLAAFLLNVQSIRYYSHASMLINVPTGKSKSGEESVTAEYVWKTVNRGSYFWSLGLHAFYFSFPLCLWIFGPIPMFFSSLVLVFLLYFLDVAADVGDVFSSPQEEGNLIDQEVSRV